MIRPWCFLFFVLFTVTTVYAVNNEPEKFSKEWFERELSRAQDEEDFDSGSEINSANVDASISPSDSDTEDEENFDSGSEVNSANVDASISPFDPNSEIITIPFRSNDIIALINDIWEREQTIEKKDEYETTANYKARRNRVLSKPLFGSIPIDSIFTLKIDLMMMYNADIQSLLLQANRASTFDLKDQFQKHYEGRMPPLRGFELRVVNDNEFEDLFILGQPSEYSISMGHRLKVPPASAKYIKNNAKALLLFSIVDPYMETTDYSRTHRLRIKLRELWLYDEGSGEVLIKIKS